MHTYLQQDGCGRDHCSGWIDNGRYVAGRLNRFRPDPRREGVRVRETDGKFARCEVTADVWESCSGFQQFLYSSRFCSSGKLNRPRRCELKERPRSMKVGLSSFFSDLRASTTVAALKMTFLVRVYGCAFCVYF